MENKEIQSEKKALDQFRIEELEQRFELGGGYGSWGAENPR